MSSNVTPSNGRVFCVNASSGHNTRQQMARGHFLEGLKNYMNNKNGTNENKILGDFNFTIDKMDSNGGNETQRLHRCASKYALSRLIVDNGLENL